MDLAARYPSLYNRWKFKSSADLSREEILTAVKIIYSKLGPLEIMRIHDANTIFRRFLRTLHLQQRTIFPLHIRQSLLHRRMDGPRSVKIGFI